jgi:hypothetical protein
MKTTTDTKIVLSKEDFSFVCPMKTEDMKAVEEGYFCAKCEKNVHDVSKFTEKEFDVLKASNNDLCVTFKKVAVVSLALGFVACSSPNTTGRISKDTSCQSEVDKKNAVKYNRLTPFKTPDNNTTIHIERSEEVNIAGGIGAPPPKK